MHRGTLLRRRVSPNNLAAAVTTVLQRPVRAEIVPRAQTLKGTTTVEQVIASRVHTQRFESGFRFGALRLL